MSGRLRATFFAFVALVMVPIVVDATLQQQRAQIGVLIQLNVTGAVARAQSVPAAANDGIVASLQVNKNEDPARYHAESLSFLGSGAGGNVIAQANKQGSVEVQASVSPNPNGTLLYASCTGFPVGCPSIAESVTAGSPNTFTCPYTVTVDTTQVSWSLDHGLFADFVNQNPLPTPTPPVTPTPAGTATPPTTLSGHLLLNNSHIATPLPAFTPFIVFSDGQPWAILGSNGGMKTYCVDLKITVPTTVENGTYTSQATYTLYY